MKRTLTVLMMFVSVMLMAQSVPYNVNKRKFPLGDEFDKLLPIKIGKWERFAFHDFVQGREMGRVYYDAGMDRVQLTFGKAYSQSELNMTWTRIYDEAVLGKNSEIKQKNTTSTSNKYLLMNGKSGFFYAWTRNLYYFSIETKNKQLADDFMSIFPY